MSNTVLVDASLALKWLVDEVHTPSARELLAIWGSQRTRILAPSLIGAEIANALHQRVRRGDLKQDDARAFLANFLGFEMTFIPEQEVSQRALELAQQHALKAVYDAHYLALAERVGCELWTADERLWKGVKDVVDWVRWIGNWQLAPGDDGAAGGGPNGEPPDRAADA